MTKLHNFVLKFGLFAAPAGVLLQGSGCSKQTDLDDENQSDELAKSIDDSGNHNGADAGDSKIADSGSISTDDDAASEDDAEGAAGEGGSPPPSCTEEGAPCGTMDNFYPNDGVCTDIGDGLHCYSCNPGINNKHLQGYFYEGESDGKSRCVACPKKLSSVLGSPMNITQAVIFNGLGFVGCGTVCLGNPHGVDGDQPYNCTQPLPKK